VCRSFDPPMRAVRWLRLRALRVICRYPAAVAVSEFARTPSHADKWTQKSKLPYAALIPFYIARLPAYD
jgi:hypothetical protein